MTSREASDALEAARKKLTSGKSASNKADTEAKYALAYATLCQVDPSYRHLRRRYR